MIVEKLAPAHLESMREFFDACTNTCFCRYWHFEGTKNEWLDRCANSPDKNWEEFERAAVEHHAQAFGFVAIRENHVVGWLKLVGREHAPKLRTLPVYKRLDLGTDKRCFSVACILVAPSFRRTGIARALLQHASDWALTQSREIEAYPRVSETPLYPEEMPMGPIDLFVSEGFRHIAGELPYPVLRKP